MRGLQHLNVSLRTMSAVIPHDLSVAISLGLYSATEEMPPNKMADKNKPNWKVTQNIS